MSYQVKIPVFEGPLDLLLHLIEKNEMDIYNIPISLITEQYLEYLALAGDIDLELTSEFLVMAATLLTIKARMLLPKYKPEEPENEEGEDPREILVKKILEYKIYKEKAQQLKAFEAEQTKVYWREMDELKLLKEFPPSNPLGAVSIKDLVHAFNEVLKRIEKKKEVVSITREEITIQEKMAEIVIELKKKKAGLSFTRLFRASSNREEIIVSFLALLELARRGIVRLRQSQLFSEILIFMNEID